MENKKEPGLPRQVSNDFLWEIVFGIILWLVTFQGGLFLTGYLLHLGANNTQIGFISTIPVLASIIAPFASNLIERAVSRKNITLKLIMPIRLLWVIPVLIPFLIVYNGLSHPVVLFVALFIVISVISVPASIAWTNWMSDIIPEKERGFYFGRRSIVAGLIAMIAGILMGRLLDKVPDKNIGFTSIFAIGAAAGFISYYLLTRLPDAKNTSSSTDSFSFDLIWRKTQKVFSEKNFMNLVWFNVSWAFALSFMGIYLNIFMLKELKMSYTLITAFGMISTASNLTLTPFWGKMADKYGNKPIMLICGNIVGITPFLWLITTPTNYFIVIPVLYVLAGVAWSGFNIGAFNIVLKLAPKEDRAYFLSVNMLLPSVTAFVGPVLAGVLIDSIGTANINFGRYFGYFTFGAFQLIFMLGGLMRSFPMKLLKKVIEPQEEHVEKVIRSVRANIAGGFVEGMGVLFDYVVLPVTSSRRAVGKLIRRKTTGLRQGPLNVLQVVSSGAFKVKELNVIALSKQLAKHGHTVIIAAKKGTAIYQHAETEGFVLYDIDIGIRPNPFKIYKLYKILLRHRIHVIHSHSTVDLSNIILASRFAGRVPIILSKYSYTSGAEMGLVNTWMFANVAKVIASKEIFRKNILETLPVLSKRTLTVYNGLDLKSEWVPGKYRQAARENFGFPDTEHIIVMIARINENKRQLTLIEAAPYILRNLPEAKFVFVGGALDEKDKLYKAGLQAKIEELGLKNKFIFTGFRHDIAAVVDAADLIVSSSLFEDPGTSLIQAMAMAKPVIGTQGVAAEIIREGINGKIVSYGEPKKLSEAVISILNSKSKTREMGKNGRKFAEEIFELENMALQIEKEYRRAGRGN